MRVTLDDVTACADSLPSNLSDKELIAYMENNFFSLQGPWKEILKRFQKATESVSDSLPTQIDCPCCATPLTLHWSVESE